MSVSRHGDGADLLQLDRQVCFALSVAARNVVALYRPLLEPMGLTHPQYLVMLALWERAPRSVTELSSVLALDPGTLSPLLKRLESAGLLIRRRRTDDERLVQLTITPSGLQLLERSQPVREGMGRTLGMDGEHITALIEQLHRLTARLRTAASS